MRKPYLQFGKIKLLGPDLKPNPAPINPLGLPGRLGYEVKMKIDSWQQVLR